MLEQIESLKKEIKELNQKIENLETHIDNVAESLFNHDASLDVESVLEFSFLDNFPKHIDENVIILHSNPYRTYKLMRSCKASCGTMQMMYRIDDSFLTPEFFIKSLSQAEKGQYIAISSEMFSLSDKFETLMLNAIKQGKVKFIILTNNLEAIPCSIREKMNVLQ